MVDGGEGLGEGVVKRNVAWYGVCNDAECGRRGKNFVVPAEKGFCGGCGKEYQSVVSVPENAFFVREIVPGVLEKEAEGVGGNGNGRQNGGAHYNERFGDLAFRVIQDSGYLLGTYVKIVNEPESLERAICIYKPAEGKEGFIQLGVVEREDRGKLRAWAYSKNFLDSVLGVAARIGKEKGEKVRVDLVNWIGDILIFPSSGTSRSGEGSFLEGDALRDYLISEFGRKLEGSGIGAAQTVGGVGRSIVFFEEMDPIRTVGRRWFKEREFSQQRGVIEGVLAYKVDGVGAASYDIGTLTGYGKFGTYVGPENWKLNTYGLNNARVLTPVVRGLTDRDGVNLRVFESPDKGKTFKGKRTLV
ncbi:MAG: hypothetical protein KJ718_04760 [Nanoarchaeota archaeon]|nr:hypothetical protein [Nanoarchaeota archaeon]MBU1051838.1 hypothetical protein [Nanoarchaeota archaeon]MBU1988751.1 hypothetical protein [Nanoarchaeota archaeon]